ncbi:hypothetical protein BDB01DRAFT_813810 [Pilobolus umbonatus]|nr:hypothetical protein BDB01DRAFT_813810 [Pilobolus umbonatus]
MDRLPAEILSKVLIHLNTTDFFHCAHVNKYWYTVYTPILYSSIKPSTKHQLNLFLASMTRHPKYVEYGQYIKELDLELMDHTYGYIIKSNNKLLIVDVLSRCPNLERLVVAYNYKHVKGLVNEDMPVLRNLKCLSMDCYDLKASTGRVVMDCYHKFRSKFTHLDLIPVTIVFNRWKLKQISAYLQSFQSLTDLRIKVPLSMRDSPVFDTLFYDCPHLENVYFHGFKFNGSICDTLPYPDLNTLHLTMHSIDIQYIHYITRRFTCLSSLTFTYYVDPEHDVKPLIHGVFSIQTLNFFQLELVYQPHDQFWQCAKHFLEVPLHNVTNKITVKQSGVLDKKRTFTYNKTNRIRALVIRPFNYDCAMKDIVSNLEAIGSDTHIIEVYNEHTKAMVNCRKLNQIFPKLTELYLADMDKVTRSSISTPSYTMSTLKLGRVLIQPSLFEGIQVNYPLLKNLVLLLNSKKMNVTRFYPGTLQLPKTGLRSLTIVCTATLCRSIVVLKDLGDTIVKAWYYDHRARKVTITEHEESLAVSQKRNTKKIFFLTSSTIEIVNFIPH